MSDAELAGGWVMQGQVCSVMVIVVLPLPCSVVVFPQAQASACFVMAVLPLKRLHVAFLIIHNVLVVRCATLPADTIA